jgi:hypothetical protein
MKLIAPATTIYPCLQESNATSDVVSEWSASHIPGSYDSVSYKSLHEFPSKLIKNFNILNDSGKEFWRTSLKKIQDRTRTVYDFIYIGL